MNKEFSHIAIDEALIEKTLKKAKAAPAIPRRPLITVIAASLTIFFGICALFPYLIRHKTDTVQTGPTHYAEHSKNTYGSEDIYDYNSAPIYAPLPDYEDSADIIEDKYDGYMPESAGEPSATGRPAVNAQAAAISAPDTEYASKHLTAARLNDNEDFSLWLKNAEELGNDDLGLSAKNRVKVTVKNGTGEALRNARVTLLSGKTALFRGVTDHNGNAYLFYSWCATAQNSGLTPDSVMAEYGGKTAYAQITDGAATVNIDAEATALYGLDIMFMIDSTGSMEDELSYLKAQTQYLLLNLSTQHSTRVSVNFYRDYTDEYVVKSYGFTETANGIAAQFGDEKATGGGNYPEAVEKALENAVSAHQWREEAVKLMFLVLDAPAHNTEEATAALAAYTEAAAEKGIRIIPVMASGADKVTELMCRQLALLTGGQFVFLTDDSGIGSSHLTPSTEPQYTVKRLIDLLEDIINEYAPY